jgi:hypothetical protein
MSKSIVKYKLYGEVTKIQTPTGRGIRMTVLTLYSAGEYTTDVVVNDDFMAKHKPQVGQFLLKQLDDSTVVVTKEEFANAVFVRQEVLPMDLGELQQQLRKNDERNEQRRQRRYRSG